MREIEFSVMCHQEAETERLLLLLNEFENAHGIRVNLKPIKWENGWQEIAKIGLYGHGPDVSEIGTTWIGSLASMQALRPFSQSEIESMGGPQSFFQSIWSTGVLPGDERTWAIPWAGDAVVVYYWIEAMEKAGIADPVNAFSSHSKMLASLKQLQQCDYEFPLTLTVGNASRLLHEASSWVWSAGGRFLSEDGKRATFAEPAAIAGLSNYYSLKQFVSPKIRNIVRPTQLFDERESVVMLAGPWHAIVGRKQYEWGNQIGIGHLLDTSYVGGSSLAIWNYSHKTQESLELVHFLSTQSVKVPASPHTSMLPIRATAMQLPEAQEDIFVRICLEAIKQGHIFPTIKRWGAIEEMLDRALADIWLDLFERSIPDIPQHIQRQITPLARRLNFSLEN